jgi:hypothetical protein
MLGPVSNEISQAVFDTLLYSDIFDFPLTAPEIHHYLSGRAASVEDVDRALHSDPRVIEVEQYFCLQGREKIVCLRAAREQRSQKLMPSALKYGKIIGSLPFVRMVALTGSLAVRNVSNNEDFDFMLVTQPGRLWTARAFVLLFGRLTRLAGHTICPNVIISENSLEWSQHDLYSARDLCQMMPISGLDVYKMLLKANGWVEEYLPNAYRKIIGTSLERKQQTMIQRVLELPFRGTLGERFERWEMNRKIKRFIRQAGFGEETIFNADICQGNFDHHRSSTRLALEKRRADFSKFPFSGEDRASLRTI